MEAAVVWEVDARACVREEDFRAAVVARLGQPSASSPRLFRIEAQPRSDGSWLVVVREGAAERRHVGPCEAAFASAALAVAVAIDPLHADARPSPPTVPAQPPANLQDVASRDTAVPPLPGPVRSQPSADLQRAAARAPEPPRPRYGLDRLYGLVAAGGGVAFGRTPAPAPIGMLAAGVALPEDCGARTCLPKARISIDFGYLGTTDFRASTGGVAVTGYEIGLAGRFGLLRRAAFTVGFSAKFGVFASAAAGRDVAAARRAAAIGAYAVGGPFLAVPLGRRWEVSLEVLGGAPVRRTVAALGGGDRPFALWTSGAMVAGAVGAVSFSFR